MNMFPKVQKTLSVVLLFSLLIFAQCSSNTESQLKKIADDANKKGPVMLDQWTRLDSSIVYPNLTIKYYHTINEIIISDTTKFKSQLKPQIIRSVKTHPDMGFFRENSITMIYQYNDAAGKYLFSLSVEPKDYK